MSISPDKTAPEEIEILEDDISVPQAPPRPISELMDELSLRLFDRPEDWKLAVLETVGHWPESTEKVDGVKLSYLVGGEAFDWRLLAGRILSSVGNAPQPDVWHGWLDMPDLFGGFTEAEFMRILGVDKSRACLSFFYGVTVEQGLQVAAREEIVKRSVASGREPSDDMCDDAYQRLYGNDREGLWDEFCSATGLLSREGSELNPDELTLRQDDQFMYWLFKRRMDRSDPARVASDTRKGLAQLERMRRSHDRRKRLLREIERGSQ
jgi:hypothetical protein